jgi:hypothetical protein
MRVQAEIIISLHVFSSMQPQCLLSLKLWSARDTRAELQNESLMLNRHSKENNLLMRNDTM